MDAVAIRYWNAVRNCGDSISSYIVRDVLGWEPVLLSRNIDHVLCVGSILFMANENSYVWGSGLIDQRLKFVVDPARVTALRGKKTVSVLRGQGIQVKDVPLGDPGVLVRRIPEVQGWVDQQQQTGSRYKAAFIPHWQQIDRPFFQRYADSSEFVVVDMRDNGLTPIQQIVESDIVVSQSLHGLIFAEALGKPTVWLSDREEEVWNFKYEDWYTTVRNPPARSTMIGSFDEAEVFRSAELREVIVNDQDLINAFPGKHAQVTLKPGFVNFLQARERSPITISEPGLLPEVPARVDGLPEDEAKAFQKTIERRLFAEYRNWAERPFTIFMRPDVQLPADLIQVMRSYMEVKPNLSLLSAVKADRAATVLSGATVTDWRGYKLAASLGVLGDAMMVRPTSNGSFNENIATFLY